jgi:sugar phosphate isomerase/epimerase
VKPTRTVYTLEPMPYTHPDSPETYLDLLKAVDRPGFGVHLDPVNMTNDPRRYYDSAGFVRRCFELLGPHLRAVHLKDVLLVPQAFTIHLQEVRPGLGGFAIGAVLREASRLDPDLPVMLEHLPSEAEYDAAAAHVRGVARGLGLSL